MWSAYVLVGKDEYKLVSAVIYDFTGLAERLPTNNRKDSAYEHSKTIPVCPFTVDCTFFQENIPTKVAVNRLLVGTKRLTVVNRFPALIIRELKVDVAKMQQKNSCSFFQSDRYIGEKLSLKIYNHFANRSAALGTREDAAGERFPADPWPDAQR